MGEEKSNFLKNKLFRDSESAKIVGECFAISAQKMQEKIDTLKKECEDLQAMYNAQCECTDEWYDKYHAEVIKKADSTLIERIKELEIQLGIVNLRLAKAQVNLK